MLVYISENTCEKYHGTTISCRRSDQLCFLWRCKKTHIWCLVLACVDITHPLSPKLSRHRLVMLHGKSCTLSWMATAKVQDSNGWAHRAIGRCDAARPAPGRAFLAGLWGKLSPTFGRRHAWSVFMLPPGSSWPDDRTECSIWKKQTTMRAPPSMKGGIRLFSTCLMVKLFHPCGMSS